MSKHLVLMAGQSNMSGRDRVPAADLLPISGVTALGKDGVWREAVEPVTKDRPFVGVFREDGTKRSSPDPWDNLLPGAGEEARGVGPGRTFARLLRADHPDWDIGLLPASVGGTPISAWLPGGEDPYEPGRHPYDEALALARRALAEGGRIEAILWHQGESDASSGTPDYEVRLRDVVRRFRRDLALGDDVPFLMGELASFYDSNIRAGVPAVNAAMHAVAETEPCVAVVSARDFGHRGDCLHFDADTQHLFGARLHAAYRRLHGAPLPKIVLLGDSIRRGYCRYVREALFGMAEVLFPEENCMYAQNILRKVDLWKSEGLWGDDVALVHWNAGLWDVLRLDGDGPLTPLETYVSFLERIDRRIRIHFPAAKRVFATTTPVIEEGYANPGHAMRYNAEIRAYNAAAVAALVRLGSEVDDLYAPMAEAPDSDHSDMTHWNTPEGTRRIGDVVVSCLRRLLP